PVPCRQRAGFTHDRGTTSTPKSVRGHIASVFTVSQRGIEVACYVLPTPSILPRRPRQQVLDRARPGDHLTFGRLDERHPPFQPRNGLLPATEQSPGGRHRPGTCHSLHHRTHRGPGHFGAFPGREPVTGEIACHVGQR